MFRFNATQNLKKVLSGGSESKPPVPSLNHQISIHSEYQGERLPLRGEYPKRIQIGDILMGNEQFKKVSPVNGIAKYEQETDTITLTQDGGFHPQNRQNIRNFPNQQEFELTLINSGLTYLDYDGISIQKIFQVLQSEKPCQIILSPFSLQNFFDYRSILQEEYVEAIEAFKKNIISLYPNTEIIDFLADENIQYEYPAGNPRYFLFRYCSFPLEEDPIQAGKIYLGAETLYHFLRILYRSIPFYERIITIFIKNKNGELEGEPRHIPLRNGMNLKDFFFQYRNTHKYFTINSFYNQNPVYKIGSDFILDIYQHESFIICDDIAASSREKICIDCNDCSSYCPVNANPRGILDKGEKNFNHKICLECGICTLFCPAHIDFFARIRELKKEKNRVP
ncbi:MAG: hypothetical protein AAF518_00580 [Spirochaetota bacterium]